LAFAKKKCKKFSFLASFAGMTGLTPEERFAKQGQFDDLEKAVHVLKSCLAKPFTLQLIWHQGEAKASSSAFGNPTSPSPKLSPGAKVDPP
jgi:hypothetical protein